MTQGPVPPPPLPPQPQEYRPSNNGARKVNGPGIALMVTGAIGFLLQLKTLVFPTNPQDIVDLMERFNPNFNADEFSQLMDYMGSGSIFITLIVLALSALVFVAGMKMRSLQSWGLCLAGSIVALIPCLSPCCCIGMPVGIWAIIVLMDSSVKDAFEFNQHH